MSSTDLRVLVVDDEPMIGKFIETTLTERHFESVRLAFDTEAALQALEEQRPDVVLLDINLQEDTDGVDLGTLINEKHQVPFIYITSYHDKQTIDRAKHTRPLGYIVKPFTEEDLITTLEIAMYNYGQRYYISDLTFDNINAKLPTPITMREYEVLKDIYLGKSNQELADTHFVSLNTIKTHIRNLFSKLDVSSRWELMIRLREIF